MLRAGLIRRLASGLYTWLPMGLRVLRKVEAIVREEMDRAGAIELVMPMVQPAELWQESGRWDQFGPELLRLSDRHDRPFCLGPTHEEVITDIARRELKSHRQLPVNFYQIQTKFRDEIRPRFGVMRAREFVMKDAYSFHIDQASLEQGYRAMHAAYTRIFERMQLRFRAVGAYSGSIGGSVSQEFHVLAESGEDAIAFSDGDEYAANLEMAEAARPAGRARRTRCRACGGLDPRCPHHRRADRLSWRVGRSLRQDAARRRRGWRGDRPGRARRSRAERGQGAEASRRAGAASDDERRARARGHRMRARLSRAGGPQAQGVCRPGRSRPRRLRLRCQSPRPASHGRQLGSRSRRSPRSPTCGTSCRAIRARPVAAVCRSCAESRSATSSSSVPSTARP